MPFEGVKNVPPPPKSNAGTQRQSGGSPAKRQSAKHAAREEAANGVGQILSFGCMVAGQLADAGAIGLHWPAISHEAANIAESDEKMAKGLDYLLEVGPYGNLIVVLLPFIGQILVNHKIVRPEAMGGAGVVHPEALEAQVKAQMAQHAAEAVRAQRAAEAELLRLQAEAQSPNGSASEHMQEGAAAE